MASPIKLLPEFRIRFPEFADPIASDAQVLIYLGDACAIFSCGRRGTLYLSAHLLQVDLISGAGSTGGGEDGGNGVVSSETVGKVSTAYKNTSDSNSKDVFYETTPYGRKYVQFRNSSPGYRVSVRSR
jgi:hypothetical protein